MNIEEPIIEYLKLKVNKGKLISVQKYEEACRVRESERNLGITIYKMLCTSQSCQISYPGIYRLSEYAIREYCISEFGLDPNDDAEGSIMAYRRHKRLNELGIS